MRRRRSISLRFQRYFRRSGFRYAMPWLSLRRWRRRALLVAAALFAALLCILFALGADVAIEAHRHVADRFPWLALIIAPAGFALIS